LPPRRRDRGHDRPVEVWATLLHGSLLSIEWNHGDEARSHTGPGAAGVARQAAADVPGRVAERRLHAHGVRRRGVAEVLRDGPGAGNTGDVEGSPRRTRRLWHLSARCSGDEG